MLTILGVTFTHGFYSFAGVVILIVGLLLLTFVRKLSFAETDVIDQQSSYYLLTNTLVLSVSLSLIVYGGLYQRDIFGIPFISKILLGGSLVLATSYLMQLPTIKTSFQRYRFYLLLSSMVLVQLLMILSSPDPKIDIFYSLKYGARALINFENPYQAVYPQVYEGKVLNYFAYFPTTLAYYSFFSFLFDPRLGIICAHVLIVFLIRRIFTLFPHIPKNTSEVASLLFLYYPLLPFITEQSFTDSLTVLLCTLLFYYIVKNSRSKILYVIVLIMNIKQVYFVFFPLMMYKMRALKNLMSVVKAYMLGLVLTAPFLLFSLKDFLYDTVFIYLQPPQGTVYSASLNLRALLDNAFSLNINPNVLFGLTILYFALLFFRRDKKIVQGYDIWLLPQFFYGLFILGGFAYLNHYFLVSQLLLLYCVSLLLNSYNGNPGKSPTIRKQRK